MLERPMTVSVVSDSPVVASGVATLLAAHADRIDVVPRGRSQCDVVLFDPTGRADADERALAELVADPAVGAVVVYGASASRRAVREASRLGVRAFLPQSLSGSELADKLVDITRGRGPSTAPPRARAGRQRAVWLGRDDGLTERESQVLVLCAEGLSNQEIADSLFVNLETVKSHLKRAYSRLGLRNRAQASAYVHRTASSGALVPVDWVATSPASPASEEPDTSLTMTVDPADLADRRRLMGLGGSERARLRPLGPLVERDVDANVARLVARWREHPETARLLGDRHTVERLAQHQRRYLVDVFTGDLDEAHAGRMVDVGVVHHRLRIEPQWYLASAAHLICDHISVVLGDEHDVDRLVTFVSTVLFDAGLVLDAYEFASAEQLRRAMDSSSPAAVTPARTSPAGGSAPRRTRSIAEVAPVASTTESRRRFIGLDETAVERLRALSSAVDAAMPDILDAFYALAAGDSAIARYFSGPVVSRLRREVTAFWRETTEADFGTAHVASRMRVGVVHEQIGLAPQWYLAGLAAQLGGLIGALARTSSDLERDVDVLVRAACFDATLVVDAYLSARAKSLLQTGRFAAQVVAGLADGVAIVDARDRIEFANEQFLDLVGVDAAVLHRMPVDAAIPIDGVHDIIAAARGSSGAGRLTAVHHVRGRTLRVIALRLDGTADGRGVLVALVLDDISDVIRVAALQERDGRRLEQVLAAVDALAWEVDAASFLFLAASPAAERVTGRRDVDLLGRARLTDLVHLEDAEMFVSRCRALGDAGDVHVDADIDHRIVAADGSQRWVRSSVAATVGPDGARTFSGVTMARPGPC